VDRSTLPKEKAGIADVTALAGGKPMAVFRREEEMAGSTLDIHKQLAMARLPSLPQSLLRIMELAARDDVGLAEMAAVVARDSGLAAKVLDTANSAYYSRGRRLDGIDQCLSVMGVDQVRRIALNLSVAELFGAFQKSGGHDMRHYWFHVLCVAITARELARRLHYPNPDEAYLAGLLHDVGQLALLSVAADRYLPLFRTATGEQSLMAEEQKAFGLTHAEVGAWLAQRWHMHAFFADALLYHHEPLARLQGAHLLTQVVNLANLFNNLGEGEVQLDDAGLAYWSLGLHEARDLVQVAETEARAMADALGIEILARMRQTPFGPRGDEDARDRLAQAVSGQLEAQIMLPDSVEQDAWADSCRELLRAARMLFSTTGAALFQAEAEHLQAQPGDADDARLAEIRIRLSATDSVIVRAFAGTPGVLDADQADHHLADMQVQRILGGACLLCLGLRHEGQPQGVLVLGLDTPVAREFLQRQVLISAFARAAARHLAVARARGLREQDLRHDLQTRFQHQASKVIHEAGNPLGVVRNYLRLLREQLAGRQQAQADMDLVEDELRRVARILQDLRNTDGIPAAVGEGVHINALIEEVIRFCRLGHPELERVRTELDLDSSLTSIRIQADKVRQVLTNLIFNAAEAMPGGGRLSISSAQWHASKDRRCVEIIVRDTGPGLPPTVLEQFGQPVPSQKEGAHQGLGLHIVRGLVDELGGTMHCQSSPKGTSFKILLPANA